ncbi:MAG: Gfo/Idh/MocA family oxidoreductase [Gammaproteobacteria bacterium]|nr:Gfo/Idh/MocA family oxidoreductase [Gammaproteobacteria bacterium]
MVKIGIVGLGRLGKRHAENLVYRVSGCQVTAACSIVEEELAYAKDVLGVSDTYTDYADMLANADIDAVFLVTSTSLHAEQILAGLAADKHVFCEKPLAINVEDCEKVVSAAAQYNHKIATIGLVRRFDPSYMEAKRLVDAGKIGQPILVRSQTVDLDDFAEFQVPFTATSGGFVHDMWVHDFDLARWFLGSDMTEAYSIGGCYRHKGFEQYNDADNASALCKYANGTNAYFFASRTAQHGHDTRTEIVGTEGILKIGEIPNATRVEIFDRAGARQECVQDFFARFEEAFLIEAQAFVDACNGKEVALCTLEDAMNATKDAVMVTEAYKTGTLVKA